MSLLADAPIYLLKLLHNAAQTRMYGRCNVNSMKKSSRTGRPAFGPDQYLRSLIAGCCEDLIRHKPEARVR